MITTKLQNDVKINPSLAGSMQIVLKEHISKNLCIQYRNKYARENI